MEYGLESTAFLHFLLSGAGKLPKVCCTQLTEWLASVDEDDNSLLTWLSEALQTPPDRVVLYSSGDQAATRIYLYGGCEDEMDKE